QSLRANLKSKIAGLRRGAEHPARVTPGCQSVQQLDGGFDLRNGLSHGLTNTKPHQLTNHASVNQVIRLRGSLDRAINHSRDVVTSEKLENERGCASDVVQEDFVADIPEMNRQRS